LLKAAKDAGIYCPDEVLYSEQEATVLGTIVDIGPDCWLAFKSANPWAKVGEEVFYPRHVGNVVTDPVTEEKFLVMTDERIICGYEE